MQDSTSDHNLDEINGRGDLACTGTLAFLILSYFLTFASSLGCIPALHPGRPIRPGLGQEEAVPGPRLM